MSSVDPALLPAGADAVPARGRRSALPLDPRDWRFDREPEARLPALLAGLLVAALVLQFLLVEEPELPPAGAVPAALPRVSQPDLAVGGPAGAILARGLFTPRLASPDAAAASGAAAPPPPPLGGASVAGSVTIRGSRYAVVAIPGRGVVRMRPGARYRGWTLRAIDEGGATFSRGRERLRLPFGGGTVAPGVAGNDGENE